MNKCKNCKLEKDNKFCPNCWNPKELKRIDKEYIISEIGSVLNFDKGILYTIKELLIRPGITIRKFIREDENPTANDYKIIKKVNLDRYEKRWFKK